MNVHEELMNMEITHTIFKNSDLKNLSSDGYEAMMVLFDELQQIGNNDRYIIINHKEPWINEIIEVMKKNNAWGEKK